VVSFHGILDDPSDEGLPRSAVAANPPSVLIFHGEEDPFSTAAAKEACLADLRARGVATEFHGFPGVKHGFTRPEKTTEEDARAGFGYDAAAAEKSWTRCKAFIAETCE
jgi:dienelactone hydrolase